MNHTQSETVTKLLDAVRQGDRAAVNELFPLVYDELHAVAQRQRRHWHGDFTINTTALVHEAYIKLADQSQADWQNRAHFFGVAARAMRQILIDYARRRSAGKRAGRKDQVSLDEALHMSKDRSERLLDLDEALRNSPSRNELHNHCPVILTYGDNETGEFKRQTDEYARDLRDANVPVSHGEISKRNHFDVILDLADPNSWLSQEVLRQMNLD